MTGFTVVIIEKFASSFKQVVTVLLNPKKIYMANKTNKKCSSKVLIGCKYQKCCAIFHHSCAKLRKVGHWRENRSWTALMMRWMCNPAHHHLHNFNENLFYNFVFFMFPGLKIRAISS